MFDTVLLAISIAVFLYVAYLILRAYKPSWFYTQPAVEPFVPRAQVPVQRTVINTPPTPIPAPAPPLSQDLPEEPRVVAPGGPNAPNAASDRIPAKISPDAAPVDPYDNTNMEAPIGDTMRFPELSFGPGVENKGIKNGAASGVASTKGVTSESPFSPEFAQNGGIFMGAVTANDLTKDDTYAEV
jgi:hypothetical protein